MDTPELQRITVAAIVRAAGRGLLSTAEAAVLIDRILARPTTSLSIENHTLSAKSEVPAATEHPVAAGEWVTSES